MKILWLKSLLEYVGGVTDTPPQGVEKAQPQRWFWGLWWAALALGVLIFSGQSSKFIYIDF